MTFFTTLSPENKQLYESSVMDLAKRLAQEQVYFICDNHYFGKYDKRVMEALHAAFDHNHDRLVQYAYNQLHKDIQRLDFDMMCTNTTLMMYNELFRVANAAKDAAHNGLTAAITAAKFALVDYYLVGKE